MRRFVFIMLILFLSCTSCNDSSETPADTDVITDLPERDEAGDQDQDADSYYDDDADTPDSDVDGDGCIPVRELSFPFERPDGEIHFCRACEAPTEKDPQCISNLWSESNQGLCRVTPEADCCGYPCALETVEPMYKGDQREDSIPAGYALDTCDIMINPHHWNTGAHTFKHFNISDGTVGFVMLHTLIDWETYYHYRMYFIYDIAAQSYWMVAGTLMDTLAYHKGAFLGMIFNVADGGKDSDFGYVFYRSADGLVREVYGKKVYQTAYTPALTETWAISNIQEVGNATFFL